MCSGFMCLNVCPVSVFWGEFPEGFVLAPLFEEKDVTLLKASP